MTRPSHEIEREVEETRSDLDRTVEALKDKMSPGQLIDELTSAFKGSGSSQMAANLGAQVRDNPLAVAMIGAGFAWLMLGDKAKPSTAQWNAMNRDLTGRQSGGQDEGGDAARGAASKLADGAATIGAKASDAADQVKNLAGSAADAIKDAGHSASAAAAGLSAKTSSGFNALMEREPLVLGGLGLAVGAALGAALPSTDLEDRTFGSARDKMLDEGRSFAERGVQSAKHVAATVYDEVRDEAEQQGLVGGQEGGSLLEKAQSVVERGIEAARADIQDQAR
ncbi:DUF3618 domain-containing protein [Caulobacter sp. 73W]|uniref:DUF3618 domain-containing protein n=1 Tax=Caulobacter sp. 73W TaxID=3161137 RepID=A0AB39KXZ6_9CAUL